MADTAAKSATTGIFVISSYLIKGQTGNHLAYFFICFPFSTVIITGRLHHISHTTFSLGVRAGSDTQQKWTTSKRLSHVLNWLIRMQNGFV
jgi:hypothetical protein